MVHKLLSGYVTITYSRTPVRALCFCRCMFSMWIFVTRQCQNRLCGLFHHVDTQNNFATPTLFLKRSGRIIIQVFPLTSQRFSLWKYTLRPDFHHCFFISCTGQLHIQMRGEYDETSAFLSSFKVPLGEWCHISLMLQSRMVRSHFMTRYPLNMYIMTTIRYKRSLFLLRCPSP